MSEHLTERGRVTMGRNLTTGEMQPVRVVAYDGHPVFPCPKPTPKPRRPRKPLKRTKRVKKFGQKDVPRLKRKLWSLFSKYVRDRDGERCVSCNTFVANQAGHFIGRRKASVLFDPKNVHSQCAVCNLQLQGNAAGYALAIIDRYGVEELRRLERRSRVGHKWTAPDLQELIVALEKSGADYELTYYGKYL